MTALAGHEEADAVMRDEEKLPRMAGNTDAGSLPFGAAHSQIVQPQTRAYARRNAAESLPGASVVHTADHDKLPSFKGARFYGVRRGHKTGIFYAEGDAKAQEAGVVVALVQGFKIAKEVENFVNHAPEDCQVAVCAGGCAREAGVAAHDLQDLESEPGSNSAPCLCFTASTPERQTLCASCFSDPSRYIDTLVQKHSLDDQQAAVIRQVAAGKNVFISGPAGSGKSKTVAVAIEIMKGMGLAVDVASRAALPSTNIGGRTIKAVLESYVGWHTDLDAIPLEDLTRLVFEQRSSAILPAADVLVLDEVSMLSSNDFTRLSAVMSAAVYDPSLDAGQAACQPFGGAQVILSADFYQLPPYAPLSNCLFCGDRTQASMDSEDEIFCASHGIYKKEDKYAFCSPIWEACRLQPFRLNGSFRHANNDELVDILDEFRENGELDMDAREQFSTRQFERQAVVGCGGTTLYATPHEADQHNQRESSQLADPPISFHCHDHFHWRKELHSGLGGYTMRKGGEGAGSKLVALRGHEFQDKLDLKLGMQVILVTNLDEPIGLKSGTLGRIVEWVPVDADGVLHGESVSESGAHTTADMIRGPHKFYQQGQILKFLASHPDSARFLPMVEFINGARVTMYPTCAIQELGNGKPSSLLSRTQIPLIPGYALPIHGSQGLTLDRVILDLEKCVVEGHAYVALSRARGLESIVVLSLAPKAKMSTKLWEFHMKTFDPDLWEDYQDEVEDGNEEEDGAGSEGSGEGGADNEGEDDVDGLGEVEMDDA